MKKNRQFFTHMDAGALRTPLILTAMLAIVLAMLLLARHHFQLSHEGVGHALGSMRDSAFALPLTIAVFTAAAFIGAPQWVLIAATVLAFGPLMGGLYAWAATLISASVNFWLARKMGAARLERLSGPFLERIIARVRKNGVLTSFAVRLVPTGPFVLVNMAIGISGLGYLPFALGTALGIVPKILVVVLLGQGVLTAAQGERIMALAVLGLIVVLALMFIARRLLGPAMSAQQAPRQGNDLSE